MRAGRSGVEERSGKIVAPSVCPPREMQERHVGIQSITHGGDVVAKTGKATEQLLYVILRELAGELAGRVW